MKKGTEVSKPGGRCRIFGGMTAITLACLALSGCILFQYRLKMPKKPGESQTISDADRMAGELNPYRSCYDVNFYDLFVNVDIEYKFIDGEVEIRYTAIEDLDTLQVDLYREIAVKKLVDNQGNSLPYRRVHHALLIDVPDLKSGEKDHIRVGFRGNPRVARKPPWYGGFIWDNDKHGFPYVGVVCEGLGASFWWPNKDHPSDEPDSMRIRVQAPKGFPAISNGRHLGTEKGWYKDTWSWYVSNPINNSNVTLNIGKYNLVRDTMKTSGGTRELHYWVRPENVRRAQLHLRQSKRILRFFERSFGPYPWWEDGYKIVETPYVGMEHQSAISYGNGFSNLNNYYTYGVFDYILLHETAHEWWGNSVSACDNADVWLHEGFATYSEVLFLEDAVGKEKSLEYLIRARKEIRNRWPLVGPRGVRYFNPEHNDPYEKGAWVLHTLRSVIDDDALFFDIIRSFYIENQRSVVCSDDFINLVSRKTEEDFRPFFEKYLYDRLPPVLEYDYAGGRTWFRWRNCSSEFGMPVDFVDADGRNYRVWVDSDCRNFYSNGPAFPDDQHFLMRTETNSDFYMGCHSRPANVRGKYESMHDIPR